MVGLSRKQTGLGSHGLKEGLIEEVSGMFPVLKKMERVGGTHRGIFYQNK